MRKLVLTCLTTGLIVTTGWAQTLFTYGDNAVSKKEFLRNYEKNALNKKPDFSEQALKEYIDLYSLFRMKVKEAERQQIDTFPAVDAELGNYRRQLAKTYLTDEEVNNKLIREAYDRMKEERHVAHIMLMAPAGLNADDTLKLYNRMDSIYNAITKKKADFGEMAKIYSEDRGSKDNGGDIGYMTSLQTLYPFETAVYTTQVGKISRPFRTALGYHIVKVIAARPARGEVQVAQILFGAPESKGAEGKAEAKQLAEKALLELKAGAKFEDLVAKYSEDKFTKEEGGVMPKFGVGSKVPAFEDAAFALKKPGDLSQPVETQYGYHIIKLIKKYPLAPFDSLHNQIKKSVENDSRAQVAKDIYFDKIKKDNNFKEYPASFEEVQAFIRAIPDTGKDANLLSDAYTKMTKPLFNLGKNTYSQRDLLFFVENMTRGKLMGPKQNMARDLYNLYLNRVVNDYQEHKLVEENEDFRNLMQEYHDGILLFQLMDDNVWSKASRDTAGLKAFYNQNKGKYQWEPGFKGAVYKFKDEQALKDGLKVLNAKKNVTDEDVVKATNTESRPDGVTIQSGRYEFAHFTEAPRAELTKGAVTKPVKNSDGTYTVVKVNEVYDTNTPKSLEDARGYVVAEYQDYLERKWNEELRVKYPVKVDANVLKGMVK